ncbi:MAG: hypothetical protein FWC41_07280 [Firmicutes bacterium]|nr:hypothetical protein [Bacillota bacterium]
MEYKNTKKLTKKNETLTLYTLPFISAKLKFELDKLFMPMVNDAVLERLDADLIGSAWCEELQRPQRTDFRTYERQLCRFTHNKKSRTIFILFCFYCVVR